MKKYISPISKEIILEAGTLMDTSVPVVTDPDEEVETQMTKGNSSSSLWDNWND